MKMYIVTVRAIVTKRMQVTAENEDRAYEIANQEFSVLNDGDDEDYNQEVVEINEAGEVE